MWEGYVKWISFCFYSVLKLEEIGMWEGDYLLYLGELSILDYVFLIMNKVNVIYCFVYELFDLKWKDVGEYIF